MGTSTLRPVFYPLEEGTRSKGKNSLWDWARNKDVACENAPFSGFLMMLLGFCPTSSEGRHGCCTLPAVLKWIKTLAAIPSRIFVWKNHTFSSDWQNDGSHHSVVLLPVIKCFYTIHWLLQSTCSLNWSFQADAFIVWLPNMQRWSLSKKQYVCNGSFTVTHNLQVSSARRANAASTTDDTKTLQRWKWIPVVFN